MPVGKVSKKTAAKRKPAKRKPKRVPFWRRALRFAGRWALRIGIGLAGLAVIAVLLFRLINPPTTPYMFAESRRLGGIAQGWVPLAQVSPDVGRAVVAAEDANFCRHWGFDMGAIRAAMKEGGRRGASTLTQQVVKNTYLWQGRSWPRKAIEAMMTPLVELFWSKRRILEVYLNVAEFGPGVFGIKAAAQHYFHVPPDRLSALQAARLAAVLPNPKKRDAARPDARLRKRTAQIMDGAATIQRDGRAACFER